MDRSKRMLLQFVLVVGALIALVISFRVLSGAEYQPKILISEVLASNKDAIADEDGDYPDFIELYNAGSGTVNLRGWFLSDRDNSPLKWRLPQIMLEPGEYVYFFASGKDKQQADGIWHTNFRISVGEEPVVLTMPDGTLHGRVAPFESAPNISYALVEDFSFYAYMAFPMPGTANTSPYFRSLSDMPSTTDTNLEWPSTDSPYLDVPSIAIMEYMSSNYYYYPDEEGDFNDWVELYNFGDETIDLSNLYLSDKAKNLSKWQFPDDAFLLPGQRIVIQLSGKPLPGHANFSLSASDDGIFLSDSRERIIDSCVVLSLPRHVSYGRDENNFDRWLFFPRPTPGGPNDTAGFEELAGISAAGWGGLYVSRVSFANWVDITNSSQETINTAGWRLMSSSEKVRFEPLPNADIDPGETKRVNLSFINITLLGQTLTLTDPEDFVSDVFSTGTLRKGITAGRTEVLSARRVLFDENGAQYSGYSLPVTASADDLIVAAGTSVSLTTRDPSGVIYYTLDGSVPTDLSSIYSSPISIEGNTVLRAVVIAPGKLPSAVLSRTYMTESPHDLPIVALTSDPEGLFSYSTGIYANGPGWTEKFPHVGANFWKRWERDVHFAFYEDGALSVETDACFRIHGQYSRAEPQKSFAVFFRSEYGISKLAYPLIPDIERTLYGSIVLRMAGQDWNHAKMRDAFVHNSVMGVTNLVVMGARPVVLYINGEYWGIYYIREKINEDYFAINEGIPKDEIDIIKHNRMELAGSNKEYLAMVETLRNMRMNTDEGYAYADSHIDLDNWIDYWIVVTFFGNTDTGNIKFYKQQGEGHKWRWILFDQDWALWPSTYRWNMIEEFINPNGHGVGRNFSTVVARALLSNDRIKNRFLERYAELMHTVLSTERLHSILDDFIAAIESEMPRQIERFGGPSSMSSWRTDVNNIRNYITEKESLIKRYLRTTFNISSARMNELFPEGW